VAVVCALGGAAVGSTAGLGGRSALDAWAADQLIFPPLPADPLDLPSRQRASLGLTSLRLPSGQHAEVYDLKGWLTLGSRHALAMGMSYVGVEDPERFQWGGGAPWLRWSSHSAPAGEGGLAIDALVVAPLGDGDLYPVAVRAPSLFVRGRAAVRLGSRWHLWVGVWGRGVSPPDGHDRPRDDYPSGAGVDAFAVGTLRGVELELVARVDRGGLPESSWVQATAAVPIGEDLALSVGGAAGVGPSSERAIDSAWTLGLQWRPRAAPKPGSEGPADP
jgi:hypothetical protein